MLKRNGENGKLKFDPLSLLNLLPTVVAIIAAAIIVNGKIVQIETKMAYAEKNIEELMVFKNQGDRFTAGQGQELKKRIVSLEEITAKAPPQWFQNMFMDFRKDVRDTLKSFTSDLNCLKTDVEVIKNLLNKKNDGH